MEFEVVKQRQHKIDGLPAGQCGEWPGIKPNKWEGSIKVIRPKTTNIFDSHGMIEARSRRHFSAKHSDESSYKPLKKVFPSKKNVSVEEIQNKGLKAVKPIFSENKFFFPKKHFPERFCKEMDPNRTQVKTFTPNGNILSQKERNVEKFMGQKKRIWDFDFRRNHMPLIAPGDKPYKNPESTVGFFKEGGLIPGSTNTFNFNKTGGLRSNNFYHTLDLSLKTLDPTKLWTHKTKKEEMDFSNNYVKNLTKWDNEVLKLKKETKKTNSALKPAGKKLSKNKIKK